MPGLVLDTEGTKIVGCAWHPRYRSYAVLVHAVLGPAILRTVIADERLKHERLPEGRAGQGFVLDLAPSGVTADSIARVKLMIGETDEWLDLPGATPADEQDVTIEDIVAAPFARVWVTGNIYFDAQLAGFSTPTIIDLLYWDYLGRPADPEGLASYSARIDGGTLTCEEFRRILIGSQEYTLRHWRTYEAPGAIFSQQVVMRAGTEFVPQPRDDRAKRAVRISFRELMALGNIEFVVQLYSRILGRSADARTVWRRLSELRAGRQRQDIIWEVFRQRIAARRDVRFLHRSEEPEPVIAGSAARFGAVSSQREGASAPASGFAEDGRSAAGRGKRKLPAIGDGERAAQAAGAAGPPIPTSDLLQLDEARLVSEGFARILGREPSAGEAAFCAAELAAGLDKEEFLRVLAGEPEAIAREVGLVETPRLTPASADDMPWEGAAPAPLDPTPPAAAEDEFVGFDEAPKPPPEPLLFGRTAPVSGMEASESGLIVLDATTGLGTSGGELDRRAPQSLPLGIAEAPLGERAPDEFAGDAAEPAGFAGADPAGMAVIGAAELPEEFADLTACGETYEPFGDPSLLDGPLVGRGFHPAETDGTNWWRWTGAGQKARIRIPVARPGNYRVAIWCEKAPSSILDSLAVRCAGAAAALMVSAEAGDAASLVCDARAAAAGFTGWLDLELRHPSPEVSADGRKLGLCIGSIRVEG